MKSTATTVPDYLASLPPDRRATIDAVRNVILENLDDDYEECMLWGVAAYTVPQRVYPAGHHTDPKKPLMMCGVSSQKNDMVVYLMNVFGGGGGLGGNPALREWFERAWAKSVEGGGAKMLCVSGEGGGGCCIRFKKLDDLALGVIGESIRRTPAKAYVERYVKMLAERGKGGPRAGGNDVGKVRGEKSATKQASPKAAKKSGKKVGKKTAKR